MPQYAAPAAAPPAGSSPAAAIGRVAAVLAALLLAAAVGVIGHSVADAGGTLVLGGISGLLILQLAHQRRRRRAAEQAALASERKFHTYFDHLADAIMVVRVEDDGRFLYEEMNQAASAIVGLARAAVIGKRPDEVWPPDRAAFIEARLRACVDGGRSITHAHAVELPGQSRRLCMTLVPVAEQSGPPRLLVTSLIDVTERMLLEEKLHRAQRTAVIGRLTAGIAHDFNNLLQAQLGSLELLLEDIGSRSAARDYAEVALRATRRGAQLTHHLLAFAGKQMLQPEAVALPPLLSDLADMLRGTIGPTIDLRVVLDMDTPETYADPGQIEVALINLVHNARDAMPAGGQVRIAAYAAAADAAAPAGLADGRYVVLSVSDDGIGMPPDVLEHACEPFFTTKGVNGSGLGLSMVQGFARQSGGDVRIASTLGRGTCIELWLPCVPAPAVPATAPAGAPATSKTATPKTGRVLLVDDSPDVLLTTAAFLDGAGFDVVCASNGDQALAVLAAGERFDTLVTDYAMPTLNGAELIIHALHLQPSLYALLITGFAEVLGLENLPGQIQVLRKPFRREELVTQLRQLAEGPLLHARET